MITRTTSTLASLAICWSLTTASAFNITMQYPAGTLFSLTYDAVAKNAINAAALDISNAITTNLAAINTDAYTASSGATNVTLGWEFHYQDPVTQNDVTISSATIASNTVVIHAGARSFSGSTLGVGGPGYTQFDTSQFGGGGNPAAWPGVVANAAAQSQNAYKRGGGPIISSAGGSATLGDVEASFSVDFTVAHGSLSLDWDGNNNGVKDTDTQLNNYWHFDHTTSPAAGKNDLYSVALHEILHALGIGTSESWGDWNPDNTRTWTGPYAVDLIGSGTNLLNPGADHIADGTMSTNALTGAPQPAAMTPSITQGTRKYLTALDLAFLRDIGYSTIDWVTAPSSPADFNNDGYVDAVDLAIWQGDYSVDDDGDADDDGDTDGRDFLIWQREYTGSSLTATVTVPEPGALALVVIGGLTLLGCRRSTR